MSHYNQVEGVFVVLVAGGEAGGLGGIEGVGVR